MSFFMLTTTFKAGVLDGPEIMKIEPMASQAYRQASPTMEIIDSYKVGANKTIDILTAHSLEDAKKGADALAAATGTTVEVAEVTPFHRHMAKVSSARKAAH